MVSGVRNAESFLEKMKDVTEILSLPTFNPLNAELNPICYLLALLRAHHFLHVSRIRVKPGRIILAHLVAITNEMQLGNGIYYSTVH